MLLAYHCLFFLVIIPFILNPEVSVVSIKSWGKSGCCESGSSHNFSSKISKAVYYFSVQLEDISFFRSWFKGLAILENPSVLSIKLWSVTGALFKTKDILSDS